MGDTMKPRLSAVNIYLTLVLCAHVELEHNKRYDFDFFSSINDSFSSDHNLSVQNA